jgi:predicted ABC-type transport system involved in lysophospholipase L1 biosynthesis ATPase subunit
MSNQQSVIRCQHLEKTYSQGPQVVRVLKDINLEIAADRHCWQFRFREDDIA